MSNPNLPTPTIDGATYYEVASQQLHLVITYPSGVSIWPNDIVVNLIAPSSTTPTKVGNGAPTFTANTKTGTIVMPLALASASQGGQLTVASLDTSWESSSPSDPWMIPAVNSSPFTSVPTASFTSLGSVEVTWSWIQKMGATAQQVTLTIAGQTPVMTMVKSPDVTATFTMAQANNLFMPGKKVAIQCIPIAPGLWATPVNTTFSIPKSSAMTSISLNTPPLVSSECTMTSLSVQGTNTMQVWWGTPEGAIETAEFPLQRFHPETAQLASASTVSDIGSCLASVSVNSTNQLVWWITETGAIDGQVNSGKGWASPGTGPGEAYPFNEAGTASTANGGSMTSLLLGNNGTILFWVDPKGAIGCCRWFASSGWQAVFDALPPGTASATTQLTTLSVGSTAYLFCVSPDGAIVGGSWSDANSGTLGLMSPIAVAPSKSVAPGGGLTSISVNAQEIAVLWTTPKNSIDIAFLFEEPYSFRNFQRPLTVSQSVLGGTGIAVYSMEANQYSVWWIGQSSDLRRTNVDFTKVSSTPTPDWPVFEEVGPDSCKQTRSLLVQKVSGTQVDAFYVNAKGAVAGLSYES
ncbi:hypothetical protein FOMG_02239 [Fusarium oxysporum f. sp. melonis 26406]|uniref:Uncharacterized protein n=1 Tax=Fusarium oxysporum f. sp. melonis 26406 TaxID=1089452 RepID=X0BY03_FUSOX|nr:hypothetical protein FOMG_02239 [Fusarium oxysporum f. sp. melonis 26406]